MPQWQLPAAGLGQGIASAYAVVILANLKSSEQGEVLGREQEQGDYRSRALFPQQLCFGLFASQVEIH